MAYSLRVVILMMMQEDGAMCSVMNASWAVLMQRWVGVTDCVPCLGTGEFVLLVHDRDRELVDIDKCICDADRQLSEPESGLSPNTEILGWKEDSSRLEVLLSF